MGIPPTGPLNFAVYTVSSLREDVGGRRLEDDRCFVIRALSLDRTGAFSPRRAVSKSVARGKSAPRCCRRCFA